MRHAFDGIGLSVRIVVRRIDLPFVARLVMVRMPDAIHRGVAQIDVRRGHVDLRAQHARTFRQLAAPHLLEQRQVLLDRTIAIRAVLAGLRQRAAIRARLIGREMADVGLALLDQMHRPFMELIEIAGGEAHRAVHVVPEPAHIPLDRLDVLVFLFFGVGIVEAQIADAAELARHGEIQANRLGMTDVQIAIRLGRKAGANRRCPAATSSAMILRMKWTGFSAFSAALGFISGSRHGRGQEYPMRGTTPTVPVQNWADGGAGVYIRARLVTLPLSSLLRAAVRRCLHQGQEFGSFRSRRQYLPVTAPCHLPFRLQNVLQIEGSSFSKGLFNEQDLCGQSAL